MSEFDASLPAPYKDKWKEACRADESESPRMASCQAPGGEAIPFIQKSFRFSGGQSKDTAEYPFGGLWSNEYLNEKPQTLTVEGFLRGPAYIVQRNKLIEALRVPTGDDHPGYIDLPFWGRFPVAAGDNYEVSESADEQGQCAVSIPFTRAGVSIAERMDALGPSGVQAEDAAANLEAAAIDDFDAKMTGDLPDMAALRAGFGQIKSMLLGIIGRIQGVQTMLNAMTGEVLGIISLVNQGIRAPYEIAAALFNAGTSIAGGILDIKKTIAMYGRIIDTVSGGSKQAGGSAESKPALPPPDNEKNVLILLLSVDTETLSDGSGRSGGSDGPGSSDGSDGSDGSGGSSGSGGDGGSGGSDGSDGSGDSDSSGGADSSSRQNFTKQAIENLYRITAFCVSARIIAEMDSLTRKKAEGYWRLMEKPAGSIDQENPALYAAIQNMRTALSRELSRRELSAELTRDVSAAAPLLCLAYYSNPP